MLTPREKSPLPKMSPEEDRTRDAVDSEPKHYQLSYSGPLLIHVCRSICLSIYLSVYESVVLSACLSVHLSFYPCIHSFIHLLFYSLIHLLFIRLFIYLFVCLFLSLFVYLFVCLFVYVCICLFLPDTVAHATAVVVRPAVNRAIIRYDPTPQEQTLASSDGLSGLFTVRYDVSRQLDGGDLLVGDGVGGAVVDL